MQSVRLAACAAIFVLAPLALVACGGDSGSSGSSADEAQITKAIDVSATSGDPAACTKYQTQKFVEQFADGPKGAAAVKQCEKDAADTPAERVSVENIEIDGDTATADAVVSGSFLDGQTISLGLVKEGEEWKLDDFAGFADFNRDALTKQILSDPEGTPAEQACVKTQVEKASDEQLESVITGDDPNAEQEVFGPCSKK